MVTMIRIHRGTSWIRVFFDLESATSLGHRLTREQIADIQKTVMFLPAISGYELAQTVCEHLHWQTPTGKKRVVACADMLGYPDPESAILA